MAGKRVAFLQGDVTRAIKGAKAAGIEVASFEICPATGRIIVLTKDAQKTERLDPLEQWEAEYRARKA